MYGGGVAMKYFRHDILERDGRKERDRRGLGTRRQINLSAGAATATTNLLPLA